MRLTRVTTIRVHGRRDCIACTKKRKRENTTQNEKKTPYFTIERKLSSEASRLFESH